MKTAGTVSVFFALQCMLILMPGIQSCKDKDDIPQDTPFYAIDPVLKSFAHYNYGSWFNYYDSANQTFDSLFVTSLYHDTLFENKKPFWGYHEVVYCRMENLKGDKIYLEIPMAKNFDQRQYLRHLISTKTQKQYEFIPIVRPIEIGHFYSYFPQTTKIIALIDSLPVENRIFRDIIQVEITKDFVLDSDTSYLYYAKNIGLVKWHSKDYSKNILLHHYQIVR